MRTKEEVQKEIDALIEKIKTNQCGDPQDVLDMKKLRQLKEELLTAK